MSFNQILDFWVKMILVQDDTGTIFASFLYSLRYVDKILCVTIHQNLLSNTSIHLYFL